MKQAKVLTAAEMKRMLVVIASRKHAERNRLAVMFSHLAGLRVGEIAGLRFDDVLETDGRVTDRVHINPAIAKGGVGRTVFVNKRLQREIRRYLEALPALPGPSAPLFRTQKNGAFSPNTLCQLFGELYRRAGIKGATSHSGRRGFITKLAHSGISSKVIMELVGHKFLSSTQKYISVDDEMKRAAVEVV